MLFSPIQNWPSFDNSSSNLPQDSCNLPTVLCISNFTVFGKLAVVFLSVKIQKILIYGLKDQKNCHKFKHQNLQNSQGY